MNLRNVTVVVALSLAIVFLLMDKCGSLRKADELKGEDKKASEIAKVERIILKETIKEQRKEIEGKDAEIKELNETIQSKNKDLVKIEEELGVIKRDFESLEACQSQYDKLSIAFTLTKDIIRELGEPIEYYDEHGIKRFKYPEGTVTFNLNEKYKKQVIISLGYKSMDETSQGLLVLKNKRIEELEKINKRLKFSSGLKSGLAVVSPFFTLVNNSLRFLWPV